MKTLTFILATFILYLCLKPGIDFLSLQSVTEQGCCGGQCTSILDSDHSQDLNKENNCDGKPCNPFQACSSCILVCFNTQLISIPKHTVFSDVKFTYQSTFKSQFTADFWQPPKIV
jgi:hypothetical protein